MKNFTKKNMEVILNVEKVSCYKRSVKNFSFLCYDMMILCYKVSPISCDLTAARKKETNQNQHSKALIVIYYLLNA